jgi:hypothetical protein
MPKRVVLIRHGDDPDDDRVVSHFRGCNIEPEVRRACNGDTPGAADRSVAAAFGKPGARIRDGRGRPGAQYGPARRHWFVNYLDRLFGAL